MRRRSEALRHLCALLAPTDDGQRRAVLARSIRAPGFPWDQVIGIAGVQGLTPAIWPAARGKGLFPDLPNEVMDSLRRKGGVHPPLFLKDQFDAHVRRTSAIVSQGVEAISALNRAGIEPMPLKGLAYALDGGRGSRFMTDIDFLVPRDLAQAAGNALESIGYTRERFDGGARHHHLPAFWHARRPVSVEIHWEPLRPVAAAALSAAMLWRRAERKAVDDVRALFPIPTDAVLLAILHGQVSDRSFARSALPLRALYDVAMLRSEHEARIDWDEISRRMADAALSDVLDVHLNELSELFGQPFPGDRTATAAARKHFRRTCLLHDLPPRVRVAAGNILDWRFELSRENVADLHDDLELSSNVWKLRLRHARLKASRFVGGNG